MKMSGVLLFIVGIALAGIFVYLSTGSGKAVFEYTIPKEKLFEEVSVGPVKLNSVNELHRVILKTVRTGMIRCNYAARFEDDKGSTIWSAQGLLASSGGRRGAGSGTSLVPVETFNLERAGDYYLVLKIGKSTTSGILRSAKVYVKEKVFGGNCRAFIIMGIVIAILGMILIKASLKK